METSIKKNLQSYFISEILVGIFAFAPIHKSADMQYFIEHP